MSIAPVKHKKSILSKILYPVIMLMAYILMFAFNQTSPLMLMFPAIMIVPALLIPWLDERSSWKELKDKYNKEIKEYNGYLDTLIKELESRKESFIFWNELNFPGEKVEIERCLTTNDTLWNKRAEYTDFMTLCLGQYKAEFPVQIDIDYEQMGKCTDSNIKNRVKSLVSKYKYVDIV